MDSVLVAPSLHDAVRDMPALYTFRYLDGKVFSRLVLASEIVHECMNGVVIEVALECQPSGLQGVNNKQKRFDPIPVQQLREANVVRPGKPRSQPIP